MVKVITNVMRSVFAVDKKGRVQRVNCVAAISVKTSRTVNERQETNVTVEEVIIF